MAGGDQLQIRNSQLVSLLGADFQLRYEPNFAWKSACGQYQALCALRGFWPMGPQIHEAETDYIVDVACNFHLTNYSASLHNYDRLIPYVAFDGTADYAYYADNAQFDILGTEATVHADVRGLTLGGWFYPQETATAEGLIGKYIAGGSNGYLLELQADDTVRMIVDNGALVASGSLDITIDAWNFIAGTFLPSTDLYVYVNETRSANGAGIPAAIGNNAGHFEVSGYNSGATELFEGYASLCFVCAARLSDVQIWSLYQQTRAMFGI